MPASLFDSAGTMTTVIASAFGWSFTADLTRHALFGIGIVLFSMIFTLNVVVYVIQKKTSINGGKKRRKPLQFLKKIKSTIIREKHNINTIENNNTYTEGQLNPSPEKSLQYLAALKNRHLSIKTYQIQIIQVLLTASLEILI